MIVVVDDTMALRSTRVNEAQRRTTVLTRAKGSSRIYTLIGDGAIAYFDADDAYTLADPLENPTQDEFGDPPHLFALAATREDELVAADLDTAYRYRVVGDRLEEVARTSLVSDRASRAWLHVACDGARAFVSATDYLVEVGRGGSVEAQTDDFSHVALTGSVLVTGRASGLVELRALDGLGVVRCFEGLTAPVIALATSDDGTRIAASDDGGRLCVFEIASGRTTTFVAPGKLVGLAFSRDGSRLIATGLSRTVCVFDLALPGAPKTIDRFTEFGARAMLASLLLDDESLLVSVEDVGLVIVA